MGEALGISEPFELQAPQHIARCAMCGLEFSDPMRNPGEGFYTWLTTAHFAYPKRRWEWDEAIRVVEGMAADRPIRVLDAGSGEGRFLEMVAKIPGVVAQGIDQNPDVVAASMVRGLNVRHGDLSVFDSSESGFDVITFWHVIEHVDDPVGILERARGCLAEDGIIMFSVPITPMSYEEAWPDPFNMPPHHLTRWSLTSLDALAERLDMRVKMFLPDASSVLQRTLRSLVLRANPSPVSSSPAAKAVRVLWYVAANPNRLIQEVRRQRCREKRDGKTLPDVALVSLRKCGYV